MEDVSAQIKVHIDGLGSARLGPARLGPARLGSAPRLGSAWLSLARLGQGGSNDFLHPILEGIHIKYLDPYI